MQLYLVKNLKSENYLKEEDVVDLVLSNFLFKNIDSKKIRKQLQQKEKKNMNNQEKKRFCVNVVYIHLNIIFLDI